MLSSSRSYPPFKDLTKQVLSCKTKRKQSKIHAPYPPFKGYKTKDQYIRSARTFPNSKMSKLVKTCRLTVWFWSKIPLQLLLKLKQNNDFLNSQLSHSQLSSSRTKPFSQNKSLPVALTHCRKQNETVKTQPLKLVS